METIMDLCEFFYNAHHIPIYLYRNEEIVSCFPKQPIFCRPDSDFDDYIRNSQIFLCYIIPENLFMGYIPAEKYHLEILLGPVNTIHYTSEQLSQLLHRKKIAKKDHKLCMEFYQSIPNYSHVEFIDIVLLLQFAVTGNKITRDDFFRYQGETNTDTPRNLFIENQMDSEIYPLELHKNDMILQYIEHGDYDAVFQYLCSQQTLPPVNFGATPLAYRKHLCYYSIALFSEAAQRGGLTALESTEIAASYYKDISSLTTVEKIDFLTGRAALFYASKVAAVHLPSNINASLISCIQYIRHNVYNHIQVSDVASFVGYSRTHITRLFKQELGFGPAQLIMRTKLEEAKILLKHTNKTLSEISTALCFSSQSHFQRSFKAQYKMTPMEFRQKKTCSLFENGTEEGLRSV